ncbi:MAG: hypothetical protein AAB348_03535 [Patescibacteria group bacterium]
MMPLIVPAILTDKFEDFASQLKRIEPFFSFIQIDIIDGLFLPYESFRQRNELNELNSNAKFELHLMVKDPIAEIEKWREVENVTNVVFHIESGADPKRCVDIIKQNGWKTGVAINPETDIKVIEPYVSLVDEILFMTVQPGRQGARFIPEVLEKIKEFKKTHPRALCSADGGINKDTILAVQQAGAEKLYIGSAITMSKDVEAAHQELINEIDD